MSIQRCPIWPSTPCLGTPGTPLPYHTLQGMTFAACWWRLWLLGSFTWIMTFTFLCFSIGDYLF